MWLTNYPQSVVFSGSTEQFIDPCFCLCLYACIFKPVLEQPHIILTVSTALRHSREIIQRPDYFSTRIFLDNIERITDLMLLFLPFNTNSPKRHLYYLILESPSWNLKN